MPKTIEGKRVAILATDGFEVSELLGPKQYLENEGAETEIISIHPGEIRGWADKNWGESVPVDSTVEDAKPDEFDALVLPGGVMNPDQLRMNPQAIEFVREFFVEGKPVGAICHGPWVLVEADVIDGREMTSWPSLKTDIVNAGGNWVDREVVVDGGLVTSRKPDDIPAFSRKLIEEISEGLHEQQTQAAARSDI
jgi:protease I